MRKIKKVIACENGGEPRLVDERCYWRGVVKGLRGNAAVLRAAGEEHHARLCEDIAANHEAAGLTR